MSATGGIVHRGSRGTFGGDKGGGEENVRAEHAVSDVPSRAGRRRYTPLWLIGLPLVLFGAVAAVYMGIGADGRRMPNMGLVTNNSYINGLYTNENAKKTATVFHYVFRHLEDEVTIYPSENYYYFNLALRGRTLSGDIHLDVLNIDSGVVQFGFVEKFEDRTRAVGRYRPGWTGDFGPGQGVEVERINDFRYAVTYGGRTVIFNLYNGDTVPPVKARLMADEEYVGPSFDESGLRFFLIFNRTIGRLYWVLNEDGFVPEEFRRLTDHIAIGDRTEFAFYLDSVNNRKILVGVQGLNVAHNNWFDGPFDQLPDNYVKTGRVEMRKYLERHFGYRPGTLDRYGNYVNDPGARAAVAPYARYFEPADLAFVDSSLAAGLTGAGLYGELTRERFDLRGAVEKGFLERR